jgi:hypothetical protein
MSRFPQTDKHKEVLVLIGKDVAYKHLFEAKVINENGEISIDALMSKLQSKSNRLYAFVYKNAIYYIREGMLFTNEFLIMEYRTKKIILYYAQKFFVKDIINNLLDFIFYTDIKLETNINLVEYNFIVNKQKEFSTTSTKKILTAVTALL